MDKILTPGSYIELAESNTALHLTNLVCYYDEVNGNNVMLRYGDTEEEQAETLERAQTLCMMPVYAKCKRDSKGRDNFGSHEVKIDPVTKEYTFGTVPIGVHESVSIEEHEVETYSGEIKKLPCLIAKQIIWKRNKNAVSAIRRLFAEHKLRNSWEIMTHEYEFKSGKKILTNYEFMGNVFLGSSVAPAYGNASKVLEVASQEGFDEVEIMIADALYQDSIEQKIEVNEVTDEMKIETAEEVLDPQPETSEVDAPEEQPTVETSEESIQSGQPVEEGSEPEKVETSALTDHDIHKLLTKTWHENHPGQYVYCAFLFPGEKLAWMHSYEMLDTEFVQVSYNIENDDLIITEEVNVKIALPVRELSQKYQAVSQKVEDLTNEVSELSKCKEKLDAIEAAEQKEKHDKEVAELRKYAVESECFTDNEIAEMQSMFEEVKTLEVKVMVCDRMMAKKAVEVSAVEETAPEAPKTNLEEDAPIDYVASVRNYLKK